MNAFNKSRAMELLTMAMKLHGPKPSFYSMQLAAAIDALHDHQPGAKREVMPDSSAKLHQLLDIGVEYLHQLITEDSSPCRDCATPMGDEQYPDHAH